MENEGKGGNRLGEVMMGIMSSLKQLNDSVSDIGLRLNNVELNVRTLQDAEKHAPSPANRPPLRVITADHREAEEDMAPGSRNNSGISHRIQERIDRAKNRPRAPVTDPFRDNVRQNEEAKRRREASMIGKAAIQEIGEGQFDAMFIHEEPEPVAKVKPVSTRVAPMDMNQHELTKQRYDVATIFTEELNKRRVAFGCEPIDPMELLRIFLDLLTQEQSSGMGIPN